MLVQEKQAQAWGSMASVRFPVVSLKMLIYGAQVPNILLLFILKYYLLIYDIWLLAFYVILTTPGW